MRGKGVSVDGALLAFSVWIVMWIVFCIPFDYERAFVMSLVFVVRDVCCMLHVACRNERQRIGSLSATLNRADVVLKVNWNDWGVRIRDV